MLAISEFPARNLEDAFFILDDRRVLQPGTEEYDSLYVERPVVESGTIRSTLRAFSGAVGQKRDIHWYVTGHTGSGKSTELRRILNKDVISNNYHHAYIDIYKEFDFNNLDYRDFILVIARWVVEIAEKNDCEIPKDLADQIDNWNKEINEEKISFTGTTGLAKLRFTLPFLSASEEIKSGGDKRITVRKKIELNLSQFIRWINRTVAIIVEKTGKRVLCIFDGLDHLDTQPVFRLLHDNHQILAQPAVSQLRVVPLPLLNSEFGNEIGSQHTIIHNIPVYQECDKRYQNLSNSGFVFFEKLIGRYCVPELFEAGVLKCLFELSAGHLRDMIRVCANVCGHALDQDASKVSLEHAKQSWYAERQRFTRLMTSEDYEILRRVDGDPYLEKGQNDLAHLIHRKAIIFFPNGDGWYGLHPALKQKMAGQQPDCQKYA